MRRVAAAAARASRRRGWWGGCLLALAACRGANVPAATPLTELREDGESSSDDEELGRWLLGELLSHDGQAQRAEAARRRIEERGGEHYLAQLALALDATWHGRLQSAPAHYVRAIELASGEPSLTARLVAWFAANQAALLSDHDPALWERARPVVERLIDQPRGIGWRARAQLVQWMLEEQSQRGPALGAPSLERLGCITAVRLAGPFGSAAPVHLQRHFPPEAPGPWPHRWPVDTQNGAAPEVLKSTVEGCEVRAERPQPPGVYYAESFLELSQSEDVILAAQGALALWVDDRLVLHRDPREWGVWARFGVQLRLGPGRHRVLARLSDPRTLLRAMHGDGTPLVARADLDARLPYTLATPELLADPNDLMQFLGSDGPPGNRGPSPELDDVLRFLVAELTHLEGEDDVASVLIAPLTEPLRSASGPSLMHLSEWIQRDPLMGRTEAADRARLLQEAAVEKDPGLWRPQLALLLAKANTGNLAESVPPLRALTERFPDVPATWTALGAVLGRLGWKPEQMAVALELGRRFSDPAALTGAASVYEQRGEADTASALVQRVAELDAGSELLLERALRRRDYSAALVALERLERTRPQRHAEWERRRQELRLAAGDRTARQALLLSAVEERPESGVARLALADSRLAAGESQALHQALAQAIQAGSDTAPLERAIDAVEARSDFAPLRIDARQVIRDYERAGKRQSGTAERVLDYAAVWVHSDGSSRMLEHEIVRVQSEEAISKFAEQRPLTGLVLNMRVIKRDGRTLEPEQVQGKPTVTFPHLEIGDYIETEHVVGSPAEERGRTYSGMRWFFREEDVAYARSEFVLIAPEHRPLEIEITGQVPEPQLVRDGLFVTRRWRVDGSPAAPVEPLSVPVQEFLPSVRVGWGNGLERRLRLLSEQVADTLPVDPRIRELARKIISSAGATGSVGSAEGEPMVRARLAYRWVQDNIKDGPEVDGPKVLTSQQGNRWSALRMLLRALDVPVRYAVVKNRLAPLAPGPMSEAEAFNVPLLRVGEGTGATWLTLAERHAPFGYVPVEARGMPGHELAVEGQTPVLVPDIGDQDRLSYDGTLELGEGGNARVSLRQSFVGKYAMRLRAGLEQVPEGRLREAVETRLLGQALPGAELLDFSIEAQSDVDAPLVVEMKAAAGKIAEVQGDQQVIEPPMMPRLSRLSTLPTRQTPLLIGEAMHQSTRLRFQLPPGTRVWGTQQVELKHGEHHVTCRDSVQGSTLLLEREVSIAAGRVAPADYPAFAAFTREAERVLSQPIVLRSDAGLPPAPSPTPSPSPASPSPAAPSPAAPLPAAPSPAAVPSPASSSVGGAR